MSKYIIEVEDEPEEGLPFDDNGFVYRCKTLGVYFSPEDLGKLEKLDEPAANEDVKVLGREGILESAHNIVSGKREEYGEPEDNFSGIAELWSAYLRAIFHSDSFEIVGSNVAVMMILLKVARTVSSCKLDNYIDMAGYAACAGELEEKSL